jgi:hydrogenase expression/formation protein HypC
MCLSVPAKLMMVKGVDPLTRMGQVSFGGVLKDVSLAYVPEAREGDYVLVHVGFAISVIDEVEANFVFDYLKQSGLAADEFMP